MALDFLMKLVTSRQQPQANNDNSLGAVRGGRYGETYGIPVVRKQHALADEGAYFVCHNSGTGAATTATPTAFSDTAPMFTLNNVDTPTNLDAKRIHLDWLRLTETAAGTAGVDLRLRAVLDSTVPTGGTLLTPVNPNMDVPQRASVGLGRLLPTGTTQTGNSRVVVGTHVVLATSAAIPALSEIYITFGGTEGVYQAVTAAAAGNIYRAGYSWPPVVIGPQQTFILEFLITSQSAASSWTVEAGWWER